MILLCLAGGYVKLTGSFPSCSMNQQDENIKQNCQKSQNECSSRTVCKTIILKIITGKYVRGCKSGY